MRRAEALTNQECKRELQSFEKWLTQREALAAQSHIICNADVMVSFAVLVFLHPNFHYCTVAVTNLSSTMCALWRSSYT